MVAGGRVWLQGGVCGCQGACMVAGGCAWLQVACLVAGSVRGGGGGGMCGIR